MEIGYRITYKNSMNDIRQVIIKDEEQKNKYCNNKTAFEILKIERPKYETIEEKKELLTEEEKEYLKQYTKFNNIHYKELRITIFCIEFINDNSSITYYINTGNKF